VNARVRADARQREETTSTSPAARWARGAAAGVASRGPARGRPVADPHHTEARRQA
jgi:hypothetical protein